MSQSTILLQLVISGVLLGGVYGLISMGFVITWRTGQVFNMAYGQFAVVGAFIAWTFLGSPGAPRFPLPIALLLTFISSIAFGLVIERVIFRRVIGKPLFVSFMLTLGLLAILHSLVVGVWGPETMALATPVPKGTLALGVLRLSKEHIWSFGLAVFVVIVLVLFIKRTKLGLAMRAAYEDQVAARCLGVSARLNSQLAWVLCAVIATIGGILLATVSGVSMLLSEMVLMVLAVVLLGGLDSFIGCMVGGLVLAIGQNLASFYLSEFFPGVESIFGMVLIVVILLVRPNGLFGSKPIERV